MEELKSTEVLEHEILEDARKKAAKILKTADDTLNQQKRDWDKKLADDLETIRKTYMDRMKKTKEDIFARLPLDKRRLRLKTYEEFLSAAINDFLSGIDRKGLLSVLERELLKRLGAVAGDPALNAVVSYSGLSLSEVRSILKKSSVSYDWKFQEDTIPHSTFHIPHSSLPMIVIDTEAFRLTASVEAAAAALLKDYREELAIALLGPEAPQ